MLSTTGIVHFFIASSTCGDVCINWMEYFVVHVSLMACLSSLKELLEVKVTDSVKSLVQKLLISFLLIIQSND